MGAAVLLPGCRKEKCDVSAALDTAGIVVDNDEAAKLFGVDICIDATPSMDGFAAPADTNYRTFLEDLEGSFVSGLKNVSDVRFYKFGERIVEVSRQEFRNARSRAFYHQPGILRSTDIELVFQTAGLQPAKPLAATTAARAAVTREEPRLIVVVTDLFQRDQDVNAVVKQIKTRCLSNPRCSVGIMAIPSQFDGTVFDARVPPYPYKSAAAVATFRPFYLLMFGPEGDLRRFADVLSSRKYVDLRRFTVIGSRTVATFSAVVKRGAAAKGVTPRAHCGSDVDAAFNIRKGFDRGAITASLQVTPDPRAFAFEPSRIQVRAFRKTGGTLVPAGDEVSTETKQTGGAIQVDAVIKPPPARGDYVYVFELVTGEVNGFTLPPWIAGFTSPDPRPERDAAKTLNLDRFVEQLIATSVLEEHHQPKLARFRVLIHKLQEG